MANEQSQIMKIRCAGNKWVSTLPKSSSCRTNSYQIWMLVSCSTVYQIVIFIIFRTRSKSMSTETEIDQRWTYWLTFDEKSEEK